MGTAPIGPLLLRMSLPAMVSVVLMSVYNLIDTLWVSGLPDGTEAIAALTVLMPLQMVAAALGMGMSAGVASVVARRFGERNIEAVSAIAGNAVTLPILLGTVVASVCLAFPEPLAFVFGGSRQLVTPAVGYLTVVAWGFPFQIYSMSMDGLIRGAGNTKTPMYIRGSAALLNAGLDPFLIYGWGPFPMLGLRGAAIATLLAQMLGAALSTGYMLSSRSPYRISAAGLRLRTAIVRDIAQVGFPSFLNGCVRSTVGSVYNWVLGGFGPAAIAAQGLSMRIMMLMLSFMGPGVSQALVPIVGFNFGARNYRRMWHTWLTASVWLSGIGIVLSSLIIVFAPTILAPFARDAELLRLGAWAVRAKVCTIFLVEPQMMGVFTFQGMGMGFRALVLTLSRGVLFVIPALLLLPNLFGVYGAFAAQPVSDVLALLIAGAMLLRAYRQYPATAVAA
ncbi:MAG: MATE family efflux transporter [Kiritimatiellae bacterium]|nr:MATE family efflux transporter [Kiritimatiellia bacterium]